MEEVAVFHPGGGVGIIAFFVFKSFVGVGFLNLDFLICAMQPLARGQSGFSSSCAENIKELPGFSYIPFMLHY